MASALTEEDLWRFATRVYAHERVRALCLRLQDDHGFDVLVALTCVWAAARYQVALTEPVLRQLLAQAEPWRGRTNVLRQLRREVQQNLGDEAALAGAERRALYEQLKAAELASERVALRVLEDAVGRLASVAELGEQPEAQAELALARYADLEEQTPSATTREDFVAAIFAALPG